MKFQNKLSTKQIHSIFYIIISLVVIQVLRTRVELAPNILAYFALILLGISITSLFEESHKRYKILKTRDYPKDYDSNVYDSKAEWIIADYFRRKSIKFYLHPKVKVPTKIWKFDNPFKKRTLTPDYFLPQYNAFVEYWGMNTEEYNRTKKLKEKAYEEKGIEFISLFKTDLVDKKIDAKKVSISKLDWNFTQKLLNLIREREGNNLEWRK